MLLVGLAGFDLKPQGIAIQDSNHYRSFSSLDIKGTYFKIIAKVDRTNKAKSDYESDNTEN